MLDRRLDALKDGFAARPATGESGLDVLVRPGRTDGRLEDLAAEDRRQSAKAQGIVKQAGWRTSGVASRANVRSRQRAEHFSSSASRVARLLKSRTSQTPKLRAASPIRVSAGIVARSGQRGAMRARIRIRRTSKAASLALAREELPRAPLADAAKGGYRNQARLISHVGR